MTTPRSFLIKSVSALEAGGSFSDPVDIAVEDGVVTAVGTNLSATNDVAYDLSGLWVMPGMFDCHDHVSWSTLDESERLRTPVTQWSLEAARNFQATLAGGVTFVRDAGGADAGMRDAIDRAYVPGPRLQVSINMLSQTGGHGDLFLQGAGLPSALTPSWPGKPADIIDGIEGMRRVVRELLRAGADWIKLCATGGIVSPHDDPHEAQFTRAEIDVAVFEARRRRVPVFAHAYGGEGLSNAVEAGVRSIEHGTYLSEEQAAQMARSGCYLCPTLAITHDVIRWAEEGIYLPTYAAQKALARLKPFLGQQVKIARAAGVKIVTGTDYIHRDEHGRNLAEIWHLYEAGLSAEEALLAATSNGAELCGVADRYGSIQPGYVFDAVVLDRDPSDMRVFREPDAVACVFQGGRCVNGQQVVADRGARRLADLLDTT